MPLTSARSATKRTTKTLLFTIAPKPRRILVNAFLQYGGHRGPKHNRNTAETAGGYAKPETVSPPPTLECHANHHARRSSGPHVQPDRRAGAGAPRCRVLLSARRDARGPAGFDHPRRRI